MAIIKRGEMSTPRYVTGGIVGTIPGFGLGHVVQERWLERGWIFTVGEVGSLALIGVGLNSCFADALSSGDCNNTKTLGWGILGLVVFKVWEFGDVWLTPIIRNREYRELKKELEKRKKISLAPLLDQNKVGLGLAFQF